MAARKAPRKKPLGPRQAAAAFVARAARALMKRQSHRPPSPSVTLEIFDPETGWAAAPPRQTTPTQEIKRRRFV